MVHLENSALVGIFVQSHEFLCRSSRRGDKCAKPGGGIVGDVDGLRVESERGGAQTSHRDEVFRGPTIANFDEQVPAHLSGHVLILLILFEQGAETERGVPGAAVIAAPIIRAEKIRPGQCEAGG